MLRIPNVELQRTLFKWFSKYTKQMAGPRSLTTSQIRRMFQAALDGPFTVFNALFSNVILRHMSYHVFGGKNEATHQTFVFGLFLGAMDSDVFQVAIEEEAGHGRMDMVIAELRGKRAVIIEFKITKDEEKLEDSALLGLRQVDKEKYRARLDDEKTQLREYGIAFCNKKCSIAGRVLTRKAGAKWLKVDLS